MIPSIPLTDLSATSKLYIDFLTQSTDSFLASRFVQSTSIRSSNEQRATVAEVIRETMEVAELHPKQKEAIELYRDHAVSVVTGQQVGFCGGPLYTLYKIQTALSIAQKQTEDGTPSVAIMWIEDNDHDVQEAGTMWYISENSVPISMQLSGVQSSSKSIVAERTIVQEDIRIIDEIVSGVAQGQHAENLRELLHQTYQLNDTWTQSFVRLLNRMFADQGLLLISASLVRKHGLMQSIIEKEFSEPGVLQKIVEQSSEKLIAHGYHIQAKPSQYNVFLHTDKTRNKVQSLPNETTRFSIGSVLYSLDELIRKVRQSPMMFSPNVLLRPIIQDSVLGTSTYVAGPGEVAYLSQLREAYEHFGVAMPVVVPRVHVTLIPWSINRSIEKYSIQVADLLQSYQNVENLYVQQWGSPETMDLLVTTQTEILSQMEFIRSDIRQVDGSLDGTFGALERTIEKEFDAFRKKVSASIKRKLEQRISKLKDVHASIFPDGTLQERKLSPIFILKNNGLDTLGSVLAVIHSSIMDGSANKELMLIPIKQDEHHIVQNESVV